MSLSQEQIITIAIVIAVVLVVSAAIYPKLSDSEKNIFDIFKSPFTDYTCGIETVDFGWPLDPSHTTITSCYGKRTCKGVTGPCDKNTPGIDVRAPEGTSVKAMADGTIIDIGGSFNLVTIKHDNGYETSYLHNSNTNIVKLGDTVTKGQEIAKSGDTNAPGNPHLDFRVKDPKGDWVDPLCFFDINELKIKFLPTSNCYYNVENYAYVDAINDNVLTA
ncbi:MAG: M23 family metallopeptidase [archaeon]